MAKYVARVRKDANSYRYFYSPAEYQAYLKAAGRASAKFATNATATAAKAGKNLGENAARLATNLTGAATATKKKVHKYVYNKNAAKKLDEMGKAHELDERSKQNALKNPKPGSKRNVYDSNSTVNRRTREVVEGGAYKKDGNGKRYFSPNGSSKLSDREHYVNSSTEHGNTPNVGKMQDAINKTLQDQQRQSDKKKKKEHSEAVTKAMNKAANDRQNYVSENKSKADEQLTKEYKDLKVGTTYHKTGPAYDEATKAKEAKARQTQTRMDKALNDRGAAVEMEVRRRRYNERQLGIEDKPKYYKPSSSELLAEFNKNVEKKRTEKRIAEGVENGEKRAEGYAKEAAYKQKRDESRRNMKEWNYEKSKAVSVKDTEERMKKKKKYVK